jgi:hypothetical protein
MAISLIHSKLLFPFGIIFCQFFMLTKDVTIYVKNYTAGGGLTLYLFGSFSKPHYLSHP